MTTFDPKPVRDAIHALLACTHRVVESHGHGVHGCTDCGALIQKGAEWERPAGLEALAKALANVASDDEIALALINFAQAREGEDLAVLVAAVLTSLGYVPTVRWRKQARAGEPEAADVSTQEAKDAEGDAYTSAMRDLTRRMGGRPGMWRRR